MHHEDAERAKALMRMSIQCLGSFKGPPPAQRPRQGPAFWTRALMKSRVASDALRVNAGDTGPSRASCQCQRVL